MIRLALPPLGMEDVDFIALGEIVGRVLFAAALFLEGLGFFLGNHADRPAGVIVFVLEVAGK